MTRWLFTLGMIALTLIVLVRRGVRKITGNAG